MNPQTLIQISILEMLFKNRAELCSLNESVITQILLNPDHNIDPIIIYLVGIMCNIKSLLKLNLFSEGYNGILFAPDVIEMKLVEAFKEKNRDEAIRLLNLLIKSRWNIIYFYAPDKFLIDALISENLVEYDYDIEWGNAVVAENINIDWLSPEIELENRGPYDLSRDLLSILLEHALNNGWTDIIHEYDLDILEA